MEKKSKQLLREFVSWTLGAQPSIRSNDGGNVLNDIENEYDSQNLPQAACVLILSDDGKILAVSRKDDPTAWGLPGGKVDLGEDAKTAAARELKEETGLDAYNLNFIFGLDDGAHYTSTFSGKVQGEIETDESGVIRWVTPEILKDPAHSPFSDYNVKLFKKLGL